MAQSTDPRRHPRGAQAQRPAVHTLAPTVQAWMLMRLRAFWHSVMG